VGTVRSILSRTVAMQSCVGNAFIQRREIPIAFGHFTTFGTTPDPALVVALHKIPTHYVHPLAALWWPLARARKKHVIACGLLEFIGVCANRVVSSQSGQHKNSNACKKKSIVDRCVGAVIGASTLHNITRIAQKRVCRARGLLR
jgi:hypothetical protein